jgi:hypothetical protein
MILSVNRQRWTWGVAVCMAAFLGGCDSGSPAAPTQTVLGVVANPATITVNQASELTVTGSGPFGNALTPGTQLVLSTTLGRLSQESVTADASGRASAILTAESQIGTATVTVAFEGGRSPQSASVDVEITAVPGATTAPAFRKNFSPDSITAGGLSTLIFTIDNTVNAASTTALTFTDNCPAGVFVTPMPNATTSCDGGTVTAVAGGAAVSYSGGTVVAMCTVSVDVTSAAEGTYANTTSDLTSSAGNSGPATAQLLVLAAPAPPPS